MIANSQKHWIITGSNKQIIMVNLYFQIWFSVDNRISKLRDKIIMKEYDLLGQEMNENFSGLVIVLYSDGSTAKVIK